jgi:hypothetical protein
MACRMLKGMQTTVVGVLHSSGLCNLPHFIGFFPLDYAQSWEDDKRKSQMGNHGYSKTLDFSLVKRDSAPITQRLLIGMIIEKSSLDSWLYNYIATIIWSTYFGLWKGQCLLAYLVLLSLVSSHLLSMHLSVSAELSALDLRFSQRWLWKLLSSGI